MVCKNFIFYVAVAAGFSLRLSSSDGFMTISRKLRNLKVAATQIRSIYVRVKMNSEMEKKR